MNEGHSYHFLKMSGDIIGDKEKEFEQTIRFVFNQLPGECTEHSLAEDVFHSGHYFFYSIWTNEHSVLKFMGSNEFQLIRGVFDTLGSFENAVHGEIV